MKIPQNTHLLFSSAVLTLVALGYGIVPERMLPLLTTLDVRPVDGFHVFRAIMGLYLGCAACWLAGAMRPAYWRAATWMNVLFMGGLCCRTAAERAGGWNPFPRVVAGLARRGDAGRLGPVEPEIARSFAGKNDGR